MRAGSTVVTAQGLRRWVLVAALVVVLAAIPIVISRWPVRAAGVDPATLRQRVTASATQAFQGYVQSSGLLGLPDLPNLSQVTALASGTTEMRLWYAAKDRWRVDVLGDGTERDLYQTPQAQFTWDFGDNQLTRIDGDQPVRLPRAADVTPPVLARQVLGAATGDRLEALAARRIAGVDAPGLRIVPVSADSTVARIDVWADATTGVPLQVEITAQGGTRPVFTSRFLEIHFGAPAASVLTPPAPRAGIGYTVTEAPDILGAINRRRPVQLPATIAGLHRRDSVAGLSVAGVYGTGLTSVVVAGLPGRFGFSAFEQLQTYGQPVSVRSGDEAAVIATGLLSVLAVRTGERVYLVAGLVRPALMQQVATGLTEAP